MSDTRPRTGWTPGGSEERMASPRSLPSLWGQAPQVRNIWAATAQAERGTGGLDPWQRQVYATQAEMFVRRVGARPEPGMTWRLDFVEAEMGLPSGARIGLSRDQRRDRIISRLRSWRLPTAQTIRLIAQAYAGADVQTVVDYSAHVLTVRFTGTVLPENLADLQAEILRVIPARLGRVRWVLTFLTWGDVFTSGVTWCQLYESELTWEQLMAQPREELPTDIECPPEVTPPTISNVVVTPTATGATITWQTDVPSSGAVDWGLDDSYGETVEAES